MCIPAILGAAIIGGAASVYSANKASSAASKASKTASQTADKEIALQREARDEARKVLTPYAEEGGQARRMYNAAHGIAPAGADTIEAARAAYDAGFEASPYWRDAQHGSAESMNALVSTNAAAGRGGSINSGKAMRAASDILTGYRGGATTNYLAALGGVADTGFAADSGIASGGQVYANNAGNALRHASGIQANASMAQGQAYGDAASNIATLAGYAAGNYQPGGQNYFSAYSAQPLTPLRPVNATALSTMRSAPNLTLRG